MNMHIVIMTSLALGAHAAGHTGKSGCPCVTTKKPLSVCNKPFSDTCRCTSANSLVGGPKKDYNAFATLMGGAVFDPAYGESCAEKTEIFDKRCADSTGKIWDKVCVTAVVAVAADPTAVPPVVAVAAVAGVTTNCYKAWCKQKWCYVDPCNCDAADVSPSTYFDKPENKLYHSYQTCGGDNAGYSAAQGTAAAAAACTTEEKKYAARAAVPKPANMCPAQGTAKCPCVDLKKPFVKCDRKFAPSCNCVAANSLADGPKKDFNKFATDAGGAFFDSKYGETCANAYEEIFDKRCADETGKIWDKVCVTAVAAVTADPTANPPVVAVTAVAGVTEKCYASWCKMKWCYVDPCNCDRSDVASSTYFNLPTNKLYHSYQVCGGDGSSYAAAQGATAGVAACTTEQQKYKARAAVPEPASQCPVVVAGADHARLGITAVFAMAMIMQ